MRKSYDFKNKKFNYGELSECFKQVFSFLKVEESKQISLNELNEFINILTKKGMSNGMG